MQFHYRIINNACVSCSNHLLVQALTLYSRATQNPFKICFTFTQILLSVDKCTLLEYEVILTNISYLQLLTGYRRIFLSIAIQKAASEEQAFVSNLQPLNL